MTHSNLTQVVMHSPNGYFPRSDSIKKITIHHMAGVMTAEQCGYVFGTTARQASSNYGIGNDGKVACYLEEENAPWTSSSFWNDNQAVTMEVSNSYAGDPWPISEAAWDSMIALCADICKRYGIEPSYTGDTSGTFTEHRMFAATGCPGPYIHERMQRIVEEVRQAMNGSTAGEWIYSKDKKKWWYRYADGSWPAAKWERIGEKWYYFDAEGWMAEGWLDYDGNRYYLQPKSAATGNDYGWMVTGAKTIGGKRYWFGEDGAMFRDGFRKAASGNWYAFGKDGARITDDGRIKVYADGKIKIA